MTVGRACLDTSQFPYSYLLGADFREGVGWSREDQIIKKQGLMSTFSHPEVYPAFTSLII